MLSHLSTDTLIAPVVMDHRGNLAFIQRTGFLPFPPSLVEWAPCMPQDTTISGPAGYISLDRPTEVTIIPPGYTFTPAGGSPYIAFSPIHSSSASMLCPLPPTLTSIGDCRVIPVSVSPSGCYHAPDSFLCRRIYYIYDTPRGAVRGGHSHIDEHRLLIALTGSMRVVVTDYLSSSAFHLNSPAEALYVPPGIWREIDSFDAGSVCLALSSTEYDPADYVRDFATFASLKQL